MKFIYNDGGRSKYFKATNVGDCAVRAICNATGKDYKEVYNSINRLAKTEKVTILKQGVSSARDGVYKESMSKYIEDELGWKWHSCCNFGSSKRTHLTESEVPSGTIIARLSKHFTCVKDGVLYDTYDCSRGGTRMIYGYWSKD